MHRLVFMGSDPIALPALNWLSREAGDRVQLVGVFTQPDRPHGRGQKLTPNAIKTWALERGLPVLQPAKLGAKRLPAGPTRNRFLAGSRRVSMKLAQRSSFGR